MFCVITYPVTDTFVCIIDPKLIVKLLQSIGDTLLQILCEKWMKAWDGWWRRWAGRNYWKKSTG